MGYVAAAYLLVAALFAGYAWTLLSRQRDLVRRARDADALGE
ncbi:MAG TPA: hypothetical protein VGK88_07155 [bacterium]|jgi:hypothetical protein